MLLVFLRWGFSIFQTTLQVEVWGWMPALSSNQKGDYKATPVVGLHFLRFRMLALTRALYVMLWFSDDILVFANLLDSSYRSHTLLLPIFFTSQSRRGGGGLHCPPLCALRPPQSWLHPGEKFFNILDDPSSPMILPPCSHQFRVAGSPGYSLPVFRGGAHPVWGLTAIITLQVLLCHRILSHTNQYFIFKFLELNRFSF